MQNSNRNPFITIHTEGALLPVDLLQRIVAADSTLGGLDAESYHLAPGEKLNEAVNRAWNRLQGAWVVFQSGRARLKDGETGTTLTRERWLLLLFQELGYGRLQAARVAKLDGKDYRISHGWSETPIHLIGCGVNLDRRQAGVIGAAKSSPHSLIQEYLNRYPDRLWGFLSNGLILRVLRDNASLTRQAYLEFDLEAMFTGEVYADFVVLWLVCHQSRVEIREGKPESCRLEVWSKAAQEQGISALGKMREGVEESLNALGSGFLAHPANSALKARLRTGELTAEEYYRQLLRLVYRLIFLFAAEDRNLLLDPEASPAAHERYMKYYSATRLRRIAESSRGGRHPDLYVTLRLVTTILGGREPGGAGLKGLGLPVLGSFLFSGEAMPDLETAELENAALLSAIRSLASIMDGNTRRVVDYKNLGTRELGSVYESLLELHPQINVDAGVFQLISAAGNVRKTTGSYYTPEDLIKVLLDSALDPVIQQAMQRAGSSIEAQMGALLALKVCDPACGSGHFLIAAARRIARRLAQLRSGDEEPSPEILHGALREVIQHCIYGVDINPMSVELCKVNLWLESLEQGKPLSFLDGHIRFGNSLVGVGPGMKLESLEVPDEAFKPVTGDDKAAARLLKKRNKSERAGQESLFVTGLKSKEDLDVWLAERTRTLEAMPEDNADEVQAKAEAYRQVSESSQYRRQRQVADLWTAAFFWQIKQPEGTECEMVAPTQGQLRRLYSGQTIQSGLIEKVTELSRSQGFFHWMLEFPDVSALGGFDCVLGNPPWERIKLQEEEFFSQRNQEIASAQNKSARQKLINALEYSNPMLIIAFEDAKHSADATGKFVRQSKRYPFSSTGDVNTYSLFTEHSKNLISPEGYVGIVIPTGIATDDMQKKFFRNLIENHSLVEFIGFENEEFIFSGIANVIKFCTLVLAGKNINANNPKFAFYVRRFEQLREMERFFEVSSNDLALLNPNTFTCPVFRTKKDADLTKSIYERVPVILNKKMGLNSWGIYFNRMFDMANDSHLFVDKPFDNSVCLYEGKMFWHFDHRFSSYEQKGIAKGKGGRGLPEMPIEFHVDPDYRVTPQYWIDKKEVQSRTPKFWDKEWFIAFRKVTSAKLERTSVFSIIPYVGLADSAQLMFWIKPHLTQLTACLFGCVNSLVFDYISKQKMGGVNLNFYIIEQLPVLPPSTYTYSDIAYIVPRVLELVYTSYDIENFAQDIFDEIGLEKWNEWFPHNQIDMDEWREAKSKNNSQIHPFHWDEARRTQLRAELDAYYTRLYGLTYDELRYILDPQDVYGADFPGETFRVLKEKELRQYNEYRTRRLVLEAWERLEKMKEGEEIASSIPIDLSIKAELPQPELEVNWLPVIPNVHLIKTNDLSATYRQAVGVAWCLDHFGTGQSIPLFNAQKYCYFLQRANLADLDIPYREFARGPYSPQVTYKAGDHAKSASYWEVKGGVNVVRRNNIKKAIKGAPRVFSDIDQAYKLVEKLSELSKDDLGGFATIDFTSRAIFEKGKTITPENIRGYFRTDWPEKVDDAWYTDENILRALDTLVELGLFQKSSSRNVQTPAVEETLSEEIPQEVGIQDYLIEQPTLSDFGLYKCSACGKMVMGYERENHEQEKHDGKSIEWKKVR